MKRPFTHFLYTGIISLVILMSAQTGAKAECHSLFGFHQIPNTLTIAFADSSSSSFEIVSYLWTFGDGTSSDLHNPSHTYNHSGTYEVCLTIHDNHDCMDTYCHNVIVEPVPQDCNALFTYSQAQNSLLVEFTDLSTSSHDIVSWLWHFGDGQSSDLHNPHHTYAAPGTYEVCLTIVDGTGCSDSYCQNVVVNPINPGDCNALFTYNQALNSLLVEFTDLSTSSHDIISWLWHFGDGTSSDQHNPHHTYTAPGTYEVCLIIHDNSGCEDSYCQNIIVNPVGQGDCMALFEYEQLPNTLTIHFINHSTSSHDITSYLWSFGDNHSGDGQNPNHTYGQPGTYEVCLTIHDNSGCTDTFCQNVIVAPVSGGECNAQFTYAQAQNSLLIEFIDQSTSGHDITSWLWSFGDGQSSDLHNPHHTYSDPGTYLVCLTIHDNSGCTDSICHEVIVNPVGQGDCMASFNDEQLPNTLTIHFNSTSTSSHDITSYLWNFGDNHQGDGNSPYHTYEHAGTYEVCLTIHDNSGCTDTYCQNVVVDSVSGGECNALFIYNQAQNSYLVEFTDQSTSTHDIVLWLWHFGDGETSDQHNPHHTYSAPGTYEVCLTIHTLGDCDDTYCQNITVDSIAPGDCMALFGFEQIPNTLTIHFNNQSTSSHDITSFSWNFGDNHNGDGPNPYHTYNHPGTYEVCLTIHDNSGCTDTYCHAVTVDSVAEGECMALFGYMQNPNTLTIHFIDSSSSSHEIISYFWNFGDGTEGDGHSPNHTYEHAGTYQVCLTIHDNTGCTDTYCLEITVQPIGNMDCHAEFEFYHVPNTNTVVFSDSSFSLHTITSWLWYFGDNHSSTDQNPTHTYNHGGTYEVCLTIHDDHDCSSTFCHHVSFDGVQECHASYTVDVDSSGLIVQFTNTSTNTTPNTTYYWGFGDGTTSTEENPVHTYSHNDNYTVCLFINDSTINCESHYCHVVHAQPNGEFNYSGEHLDAQNVDRKKAEKNIFLEHLVSIYPNPFVSTTTLQYTLTKDAEVYIELSDMFGNRIRQIVHENELSGVQTHVINSGNLNPGIYMVKLIIGNDLVIKKIAISN